MVALVELNDAEFRASADEVLGQTLSGIDIGSVATRAGRDHDGEPAVFVAVNMRSGSAIIPPRLPAQARAGSWTAMESHGEERLACVSADGPDDEVPPSSDVPT